MRKQFVTIPLGKVIYGNFSVFFPFRINHRTFYTNMSVTPPKTSLVTPLMWKSQDTFEKSLGYLWTNPLQWDPYKKLLIYNKLSRKLVPYFFLIPTSFFLVTISLLFLLLSGLFGVVELSIDSIIITICFLLYMIFGLAMEATFLAYGQECAIAFNFLNILEKSLQTAEPRKSKYKFIHKSNVIL